MKGYTQGFHDHKWTQAIQAIMALFPSRNACRIFMCQNTKADMSTFPPDQTNDESKFALSQYEITLRHFIQICTDILDCLPLAVNIHW